MVTLLNNILVVDILVINKILKIHAENTFVKKPSSTFFCRQGPFLDET